MLVNNHANYKRMLQYFTCTIALMLVGCNFGSSNNNTQAKPDKPTLQLRFATPKSLRSVSMTELRAYVTIDGGTPIPLEVNTNNTITGTINNVTAGERELIITYYKSINGTEVRLATFSTALNVHQGQVSTVELTEDDLDKNIDDDLDGYTNLAEINANTNPLDKSDTPHSELPWVRVANGTSGSALSNNNLAIKYGLGESVNGIANSTNFKIVVGFNHSQ